jgi:Protein phosphatase 2C
VPSWPYQGEYASTTRFIIDDPYPEFDFEVLDGKFDRIAVFSDGIERLVLDHREKTAPKDFFDRLSGPVASSNRKGRDRRLSQQLRSYLNGKTVCEATDDDKSLILAARA